MDNQFRDNGTAVRLERVPTDLTLEDVFLRLTSGDHARVIIDKNTKGAEEA